MPGTLPSAQRPRPSDSIKVSRVDGRMVSVDPIDFTATPGTFDEERGRSAPCPWWATFTWRSSFAGDRRSVGRLRRRAGAGAGGARGGREVGGVDRVAAAVAAARG